jgi:hypothetical protein
MCTATLKRPSVSHLSLSASYTLTVCWMWSKRICPLSTLTVRTLVERLRVSYKCNKCLVTVGSHTDPSDLTSQDNLTLLTTCTCRLSLLSPLSHSLVTSYTTTLISKPANNQTSQPHNQSKGRGTVSYVWDRNIHFYKWVCSGLTAPIHGG